MDCLPDKILYVTFNNICKNTAMTNRSVAVVNALSDKGFDVEIACLAVANPNDTIPDDLNPDIKVKFYARRRTIRTLSYLISLSKFFFEIMKSKNIILYLYGYYWSEAVYFSIINFFKRFYIIREINEFPKYDRELNLIEEKLFKIILKKTNLIVVINKTLKVYLTQFTKTPVVIMNMTVDFTRFENLQTEERNIITYCGGLSENKDGLLSLMRAFAIFLRNVPESYNLRVIGDNSNEKLFTPILDLCRLEKIENHVEFLGSVNRNRIPILLSDSKMLVLCRPDNHRNKGGFPTKLGEYLATGLPVVVTNVGEISSFLEDSISCYLAKSSDPETFATKMLEVVNDYDKAKIVGLKGKKIAETAFSAKTETSKLLPYLK